MAAKKKKKLTRKPRAQATKTAAKKKRKARAKRPELVENDTLTEIAENPAALRRILLMLWRTPMRVLDEMYQDRNTPAQFLILIRLIRNLVYDGDIHAFTFFMNMLFAKGQVFGIDFEDGDANQVSGANRVGPVQLMLPANGSENLDFYSPSDLVQVEGLDDE